MEDLIQRVTKELADKINAEKEKIVEAKLKQMGYNITLKHQEKFRFKDIMCEIRGNEERWYYNDGTYHGLRIITFVNEPIDFDTSSIFNNEFKVTSYVKYY